MIRKLRERSELTILITTHYMEEADKLCDRIAIVDHGKLAALDTPTRLKDSISGIDTVEAEFVNAPSDWISRLQALPHVTGVTQREDVVHITSSDGPATIAALMDLTRSEGVGVKRVSVQSTTLDDVFVHYTGSDLRDASNAGARYDIGHLYR
jgi:ABC-2 type transport system ATP-binding protein